jgi:hypothetical protein
MLPPRDEPETDSKSIPITYHMISDDSEEVAPKIKVVDARLAFKTFKELMRPVEAHMQIGRTTGTKNDDEVEYDFRLAGFHLQLRSSRKNPKSSVEDFLEEDVEQLAKCVDYIDELSAKFALISKTGREAGFCSVSVGNETVDGTKQLAIKTLYALMQSVDSIMTICILEDDEVHYQFNHAQCLLKIYKTPSGEYDEESEKCRKEIADKLTKFVDSLDALSARFALIAKAGRKAGFCSVGDERAKKRARM